MSGQYDDERLTWEARVVRLLESIDGSLKVIAQSVKSRQPKAVATDRDLDGQYGNPVVKMNPRDWSGPSFKGLRLSECPAPFLEMLAEVFDYFADQSEQKNERTERGRAVADFKRADAARARGWAKRVRDGHPATKTAPAAAGAMSSEWDDGAEQDAGWR